MLETDRLILRRWKTSDLEWFSKINSDPLVMKYFPVLLDKTQTLKLILQFESHWNRCGFGLFVLEEKKSGRAFGFTGLYSPNFTSFFTPKVEIGWRLDRNFWGLGYAKEAALSSLRWGFQELGLTEVVSFTSRINLPSIAVMQSIGMKYSGEFDHPRVRHGHPLRRHVLYRITADDRRESQNL